VDESAESISTLDVVWRPELASWSVGRVGFGDVRLSARCGSVAVVMVDEDAEHAFEMAMVEDQEPVETFRADGADGAFGDRVRRSHRRPDDLDPFASEDRVKVVCELAVAIAD
jgi:hypothetical protein